MEPPEDSALRLALLSGSLSVRVAEVDIRRAADRGVAGAASDRGSALLAGLAGAIETDYILRVSGGGGSDGIGSAGGGGLEAYSVSKRYVDLRVLSSRLRRRAEAVVAESTQGASHLRVTVSAPARLNRLFAKGTEAFRFLTNTETGRSDIASGLDSAFAPAGEGGKMTRRPSAMLNAGAPACVRSVLEGVDDFHESIFSERRQFGGRTDYDQVAVVASRRRGVVDGAFGRLLDEVGGAGLVEARSKGNVPPSLMELVGEVETFLLTDAVDSPDDDDEVVPRSVTVSFVSTRRRQSLAVREEEERTIREGGEVVMAEGDGEGGGGSSSAKVAYQPAEGLLPDDPLDFAVVVALGTVLLKLFGRWSVSVGLDAVLALCAACVTGGYLLRGALHPVPAAGGGSGTGGADDAVGAAVPAAARSPTAQADSPRPKGSRRDLMQRGLNKGRGKAQSLRSAESQELIRSSLRSTRGPGTLHFNDEEKAGEGGDGGPGADDRSYPVVETRTLERFPDGARLGSHLNMYSAPPASNFRVRGPDYLTDRKKIHSADYLLGLRGCDLFLTDDPPTNIGRHPSLLAGRLRDVPTLIVSFRLPWGVFLSYYEVPPRFLPFLRRGAGHGDPSVPLPSTGGMTPGERTLCDFLLADADERNEVLKIVPVAVEAPWIVRRVVNGSPALVGKKMPIEYIVSCSPFFVSKRFFRSFFRPLCPGV